MLKYNARVFAHGMATLLYMQIDSFSNGDHKNSKVLDTCMFPFHHYALIPRS